MVLMQAVAGRCDDVGMKRLSTFLSGDRAVQQVHIPFSVDVESEVCVVDSLLALACSFRHSFASSVALKQTEAVYTLLTRSATAHHLADLRLDEPSRLAALIAISQLRVKAAGHPAALDAERSLSELESAWTALLALDQGGGDSIDGGQVQEGELLTRAREAKAKLEIAACSARGESVPSWARHGFSSDVTGCSSLGLGGFGTLLTLSSESYQQTICCRPSLRPSTRSLKVSAHFGTHPRRQREMPSHRMIRSRPVY